MRTSAAAIGTPMDAAQSFSSNVNSAGKACCSQPPEVFWRMLWPDDEYSHGYETGVWDSTFFCSPLPKDSDPINRFGSWMNLGLAARVHGCALIMIQHDFRCLDPGSYGCYRLTFTVEHFCGRKLKHTLNSIFPGPLVEWPR
jgi:hypothetical protein